MRDILLAFPDRIPEKLVLQVFHKPEIIRCWALENGFHLLEDLTTSGQRRYTIMSFRKADNPVENDPAYEGVDRESALLFGPFVLKREDRQFDLQLQQEEAWWRKFDQLSDESSERLKLIRKVMVDRNVERIQVG